MSEAFSDQPGPDRKRPSSAREDISDQPGTPKLGSLAQAARGKQLNQARGILIAIGILTIVVECADIARARDLIHNAVEQGITNRGGRGRVVVNEAKVQEIEQHYFRLVLLIDGAFAVMGVLFVIFGLLIKKFPVPATIISLVLYLGGAVVFALINPAAIAGVGLIVKLLIVIALIKAVQAAWAYEKEVREEAALRSEY